MPLMSLFNRKVTMRTLTSVYMVERRSCNHEISSHHRGHAVPNDQLGIGNFTNWRQVFRTLPKKLSFDNKDQQVSFQYPVPEEEMLLY